MAAVPPCRSCGRPAACQVDGERDQDGQAIFVCVRTRCWQRYTLFPPSNRTIDDYVRRYGPLEASDGRPER